MTVSTLAHGAEVAADGEAFKLQYDMDPDVVLRLPDKTELSGSVGGLRIVPGGLVPVPGRFHYEEGPRTRPFLIGGRELWGQSFRASAPGITADCRDSFLALWTIKSTDPYRDHSDDGLGMPHRHAVQTLRRCLDDGATIDGAAFLAALADRVTVQWFLGGVCPPCMFEGQDVDECGCGEEHWARW